MVLGGTVSYAPGYGVSGTGVYTDGGVPEHLPEMPVLDNSYYENLIAVADSSDPQVLHGDQHFSDYDFSGPPVFVDGDVTISGVTNGGGGTIVANGDIRVSGVLTGPVNIFSGEDIEVSGPAVISSTANLLYASENIGASSSTVIYGSLLSAGIGISGSAAIYGILYSWDMAVDFSGGAAVQGSVVNPASHTYNGNVVLNYDPAFLPAVPPPGMSGGGLEIVAGSVKAM
jgi:hypothetical protein